MTLKEIKENIYADSYSRKENVFTVRVSFFYRMGKTVDSLINHVLKAYPKANIIDSGEVWKPFRGGATIAQGSHWFVKFTL